MAGMATTTLMAELARIFFLEGPGMTRSMAEKPASMRPIMILQPEPIRRVWPPTMIIWMVVRAMIRWTEVRGMTR